MTRSGRVGMCSRFDAAPIVTCRDGNGVDSVHDPFIMSRGSIRINFSELIGVNDPLSDLRSAHRVGGESVLMELQARSSEPSVGEVTQYTEIDSTSGEGLHPRREALGDRVDRVSAHGIEAVDDQM